jgi:mannonate dehydratase
MVRRENGSADEGDMTDAAKSAGSAREREIVGARIIVTSPGRNFVTLKIETRGGVTGLGDATLNGRELAVAAYLEEHVIPNLIGRDAGRIYHMGLFL